MECRNCGKSAPRLKCCEICGDPICLDCRNVKNECTECVEKWVDYKDRLHELEIEKMREEELY